MRVRADVACMAPAMPAPLLLLLIIVWLNQQLQNWWASEHLSACLHTGKPVLLIKKLGPQCGDC